MIDIRHIRYFLAVASERNFTRAAERLNMAQPPLSRQIQQLEEMVGAQLFDRESRPLRLTQAGALFHEHALQVMRRMDELTNGMRRFVAAKKPRYVIGFVASTIYGRLPDVVRGFRAARPDIEVRLVEMMSIEQVAALKDGRIDVGFGRIAQHDPAVRREVLRDEPLVVGLPLGHPLLAGERAIELRDLVDYPLIVYPREPRPSYADQVLALFHDEGLTPPVVHEVRELQTALGLVAAEAGTCIVPSSVHRMGRRDIVYRELARSATSPIIMSCRADDDSENLHVLHDAIRKCYADWGWSIPKGLVQEA